MNSAVQPVASSFRDPGGFVFVDGSGELFRQINKIESANYELLMGSGLYDRLVAERSLIPHVEEPAHPALSEGVYKIIRPDRIRFVSHPFEWCFSQLRDAALLTLRIQRLALAHGMSLKDATAYNVLFAPEGPIFVDTLSFEPYREGEGWVGYRQFCQHFLAPLALVSRSDARLNQLLRVFIDGVPLDLASKLLPASTWIRPSLMAHIHLHARAQRRHAERPSAKGNRPRVSRTGLIGLIDNLEATVQKLSWDPNRSEWAQYYAATNYSDSASAEKGRSVAEFIDRVRPATVWDLGANTGRYSQICADRGAFVVAFDADVGAVDLHYQACRGRQERRILPLILDLTNPSSAVGWAGRERPGVFDRGTPDAILALALIHHLAIGNNLPLPILAQFFAEMAVWLVIEFVPKDDSQVQRMLASRADIFPDYDKGTFERVFARHFELIRSEPVAGTERTLYLMKRRTGDPRTGGSR
jgi:hypothetical protein